MAGNDDKVKHKEARTWSHWRGSPDAIYDIMLAAQRADDEVRGNRTAPDYVRLVSGTLTYEDREEELHGMADIRQALDSPDFARMQRMSVFFGYEEFGVRSFIMITSLRGFDAIYLSVEGSDRMKVPGVARAIANVIDVGKRRFTWAPTALVPRFELLTEGGIARTDRLRFGAGRWAERILIGTAGTVIGGLIIYFLTK